MQAYTFPHLAYHNALKHKCAQRILYLLLHLVQFIQIEVRSQRRAVNDVTHISSSSKRSSN